MYSLYTYKQGFGGESFLALETHDRPYSAPVYWLYRRTLEIKRNRDRRKHEAELRARERASAEKAASAAKPAKRAPHSWSAAVSADERSSTRRRTGLSVTKQRMPGARPRRKV